MHLDTMEGKTVVITGATSGWSQRKRSPKMGARIGFVAVYPTLLLGNLCRDSLHLAKAGQISKVCRVR